MVRNKLTLKENQEESLIRVSPLLPVSVYLTDFSDESYPAVRWHWHEDFQLCLVTAGGIRLQAAGRTCHIEKGSGFFINSRFAHSMEPAKPNSSYYCLNFPPDLIAPPQNAALRDAVLVPFISGNLPPVFLFDGSHPTGVRLSGMIRRIISVSENEKSAGWELLIQGEIVSAWPNLLKLASHSVLPDTLQSSITNERLTKIMDLIHTRYPEKLTLNAIAASVNLCPEECERFFKRMTGMTLFQYLIEYRITKSREFLADHSFTIAEIAQNTGFSSQSYFTSCFKKFVGCTPNKYRKK